MFTHITALCHNEPHLGNLVLADTERKALKASEKYVLIPQIVMEQLNIHG